MMKINRNLLSKMMIILSLIILCSTLSAEQPQRETYRPDRMARYPNLIDEKGEPIEYKDFYPGRVNICFSADYIKSYEGEFDIWLEKGIIQTPFYSFNEICKEFEIINLIRLNKVKDRSWHKNGQYPMNVFHIEIKDHSKLNDLIKRLKEQDYILWAEYDIVMKQTYTPNDPMVQSQWAIRNIEAMKAWTFETGSPDIIIGIVDSGVKWNHPDLQANIYINQAEMHDIEIIWETGEILGGNGQDDDGNGYIDDPLGWDFVEGTSLDYWEDNNPFQVRTGNEHGTHVAGCAAAVGDNGIGVAGPAYNAKIMVTKHSFTDEATRSIYFGYDGIYYCVDTGANIINCSWGGMVNMNASWGQDYLYYANLVASYAKEHNALVFAGAGNDNIESSLSSYIFLPADAPDVISVAATSSDDRRSSFSNYGYHLDIAAPGSGILSTYYEPGRVNSYSGASGTSMASPVAAGVAALIWSYYPDISIDSLIVRLKRGCDPIDHLHSANMAGKLGAGRVNAFNSLMFDKLPYITYENMEIVGISGGDNTLNPGEDMFFKVNLRAKEDWLPALASSATLTSTSPFVEIINGTVTYPFIANGTTATSDSTFWIRIANDCPVVSNIPFTLTYTALADTGMEIDYDCTFSVKVTRDRDNWPLAATDGFVRSSIVWDLNTDGVNEIIITKAGNKVDVLNPDKESLPGFPLTISETISQPLSIVKNGNDYEIVIVASSMIYKINHNAEITAEFTLLGSAGSAVVAYDIDGDGIEEIAIGTRSGNLYLLENDLTPKAGYPKSLGSPILSLPVIADFDRDKQLDLIANTSDRKTHIFTIVDGQSHSYSPITTNVHTTSGAVLAQNETETVYLIAGVFTNNDNVKLINSRGQIIASTMVDNAVSTQPIIADLTDTEQFDIIVITITGKLYIFNEKLEIKDNFPITFGAPVAQHPILADIDGDGCLEIIVTVDNGNLVPVKHNGTIASGFPDNYASVWSASPVVADIEGSGKLNLLVANYSNLYYLTFNTDYTESTYPVYAYTRTRNAVYNFNFEIETSQDDITNTIPIKNKLLGNYPNPFNPSTTIEFTLAASSPLWRGQGVVNSEDHLYHSRGEESQMVSIDIYNIKGQKIRSLVNSTYPTGTHTVIWNGTDDDDQAVSSGIYFYRMKTDSETQTKKMVLMK